jgi:ABC-type multidrug transport system fused ATPase/permease subunit
MYSATSSHATTQRRVPPFPHSVSLCPSSLPSTFRLILFFQSASFIGYFYYTFAVGYLNTGRDLRRMESNSRSPIFSDFGELLQGIVTVRAFSAEKRFLDNLHTRINATTQVSEWTAEGVEADCRADVVYILDDKSVAST